MNVVQVLVMQMQLVLIVLAPIHVLVIADTLEMELHVLVRSIIVQLFSIIDIDKLMSVATFMFEL